MKKLFLSIICCGFALALCQHPLLAQNCGQYNRSNINDIRQKIFSTPYISTTLKKWGILHIVSEEYARQLLSSTSVDDPSFEQALQKTANCWVTNYFSPRYGENLNEFDNNAVLCFLMFNSRTLTINDDALDDWVSNLEEMNVSQKKKLQNKKDKAQNHNSQHQNFPLQIYMIFL